MRVLWLCNIMLPAYAKAHGLEHSVREGWLSGCFNRITKAALDDREITLGVCFPYDGQEMPDGEVIDGVSFYGFHADLNHPEVYDGIVENRFHAILDAFNPDVLHIFGTEFPHCLAMLRAFGNPNKALVGIQGVCGRIAEEYMAGIPEEVQKSATLRDKIKEDTLIMQQEKYRIRGGHEREALLLTGNVTGRTLFDKTEVSKINPQAHYYPLNETMRSSFYDGKWEEKNAVPHSIFLSQGDYPLKGFHFVLQAMPKILEKYPDAHLYVSGNNIIGRGQSKYPYFLRASAYGKYIKSLISAGKLKKHVTMVGMLDEEAMKQQFLRSSLYLCASVVENSPNSLGEAMLLGMPIVTAEVGGIPSLATSGKECLFFDKGDPEKLAEAVCQMWDEPVIAGVYGDNARKRALLTHDADTNYNRLLEIYRDIASKETKM